MYAQGVKGGQGQAVKPTWRQNRTDKQTDKKTHRKHQVGDGKVGERPAILYGK